MYILYVYLTLIYILRVPQGGDSSFERDNSSNFSITEDKLATLISAKLLKDESFVRDVCSVVVEQNRTRKVSKFDYNFYLIDNF